MAELSVLLEHELTKDYLVMKFVHQIYLQQIELNHFEKRIFITASCLLTLAADNLK